MQVVAVKDAMQYIDEALHDTLTEPIRVEADGKPIAILLPFDEYLKYIGESEITNPETLSSFAEVDGGKCTKGYANFAEMLKDIREESDTETFSE